MAELKDGSLKLTAAGRIFAHGSTDERKRLFKEHLLRFVPLAAHMCRVLAERPDHRAHRLRFQIELEDHLTRRDAEEFLALAPQAGISTATVYYPLAEANRALADLRNGALQGAAVLVP